MAKMYQAERDEQVVLWGEDGNGRNGWIPRNDTGHPALQSGLESERRDTYTTGILRYNSEGVVAKHPPVSFFDRLSEKTGQSAYDKV
jgi:hypothetical protein